MISIISGNLHQLKLQKNVCKVFTNINYFQTFTNALTVVFNWFTRQFRILNVDSIFEKKY